MINDFLKPLFQDLRKFVLDTLFPISCLSCGTEGEFLCAACASSLNLAEQRCIVCQKPSPSGLTHAKCQSPHAPEGLISIFDYHDERVAKAIIQGKYYFLRNVFEIFGRLIAKKLADGWPEILKTGTGPVFVPVPLHWTRQRWRGFNQAEVLCQTLARELSLPSTSVSPFAKASADNLLVRCKPTKTQKDLKKDQRIKNLESSFRLSAGADVHGQNLILVDDVTTTGATLLEAVKVLKRNGAARVFCLTIAKD